MGCVLPALQRVDAEQREPRPLLRPENRPSFEPVVERRSERALGLRPQQTLGAVVTLEAVGVRMTINRRDFLKILGIGSAAVALSPAITPPRRRTFSFLPGPNRILVDAPFFRVRDQGMTAFHSAAPDDFVNVDRLCQYVAHKFNRTSAIAIGNSGAQVHVDGFFRDTIIEVPYSRSGPRVVVPASDLPEYVPGKPISLDRFIVASTQIDEEEYGWSAS